MNTRTITVIGAVAAMLSAGYAARADSVSPYQPNIPPVAYLSLYQHNWDYMDLRQAKDAGLSDSDIATVAKISDKTGVPFNDLFHQVLDGTSFITLCSRYGLNYNYVRHTDDYQDKIRDYKIAYENTGIGSARKMVAAYQEGYLNPAVPLTQTSTTVTTTTTTTLPITPSTLDAAIAQHPELSTFYRAIQAAGLDATLTGPGPYTVFAPTNDAFAKLDPAALNALLADQPRLTRVVEFHIIPGRISAADAMTMNTPTSPATLEGDTLAVTHSGSNVMIDNGNVTQADIPAGNGVIHEIDAVLMPAPATMPLTGTVPATP